MGPRGVQRYFPLTNSRGDRIHLRTILRSETVGGMIMLGATLVALLWANLAPVGYEQVSGAHLGPLTLAHWASDGLLTIFFFVAGLELKRELTEGALRQPRRAALPTVAAIAGMIVPALIYLLVQALDHGTHAGWAVPMATDIAFALAILAIAGRHLPSAIRSFLLTLAIVDDLGAIVIIAVAFTASIHWLALAGAAVLCLLWFLLQRRQLTAWWIFLPLGVATWALTLASGVHATIAGVVLGLLTYCSADDDNDVLDRWENAVRPWSAGVAVPIFALFSAGVHIDMHTLASVLLSPVALGILAALLIGKPLGVFGGTFLTAKLTRTKLRQRTRWRDVAAASHLAGIGFTVALLLAELSFSSEPEHQAAAKAAVLLGSMLSATIGALLVARRSVTHRERKRREAA